MAARVIFGRQSAGAPGSNAEIVMGLPRAFLLLIAGAFFCPSAFGVDKLDVEWKVCC